MIRSQITRLAHWLLHHADLSAFAAWACVVFGVGAVLAGLDSAARGDAPELARTLLRVGCALAFAGAAACVVLAGRAPR